MDMVDKILDQLAIEPLGISELEKMLGDEPRLDVIEAVWVLIDAGKVRYTWNGTLEATVLATEARNPKGSK